MPKRKLRSKNGGERLIDISNNAIQGQTYDRLCRRRKQLPNPKTRGEIEEAQKLDAEIERRKLRLPPTPPIVVKERARRGKKPSCLYFGLKEDFHKRYPGYKFCSHCEEWENYNRARASKKIKRDSQRFICEGGHENWVHPSTKVHQHYTLRDAFNACASANKCNVVDQIYGDSEQEEEIRVILMGDGDKKSRGTSPTTIFANHHDQEESIPLLHGNQPAFGTSTTDCSSVCNEEAQQHQQDLWKERLSTKDAEICSLKKEISDLRHRLKSTYRRNCSLNARLKNNGCDSPRQQKGGKSDSQLSREAEKDLVRDLLVQIQTIGDKRRSKKNRFEIVSIISDTVLSNTFFQGSVKERCQKRFRDYIRKEVYSPWKILRAMDLSGGGLCYNGIEILRTVETQGRKYYRNSLLPSAAEMKRVAKLVENFAVSKGLRVVSKAVEDEANDALDGAESIEFEDIPTVTQFIAKAFNLHETAQTRSISVSAAIDAAQLSKRHIHTTMGIKVNDKEAVCPLTHQPIFGSLEGASDCTTTATLVQSRNNCFPLKIILAKETKDIYKHFADVFNMFTAEDEKVEDATHSTPMGDACRNHSTLLGKGKYPIRCCVNCDMSAQWKGLCRGCAMKSGTYPCQCCGIHNRDIAVPNPDRCSKWCREYSDNFDDSTGDSSSWNCYHHDILTETKLADMQGELEDLKVVMNGLANRMEPIHKASTIRTNENPHTYALSAKSSTDITSIHYDLDQAIDKSQHPSCVGKVLEALEAQLRDYAENVTMDLVLRGLDRTGTLVEKRERLRHSLIQEYTIGGYHASIAHGNLGANEALFVLMNTLPCILHLENRVGLKMFQRILQIGLQNVQTGDIICQRDGYANEKSDPESLRIKRFFKIVHDCVNCEIFGSPHNPTQWECPYDKGSKQIQSITLDNNRTRSIIQSFDLLVDICIPSETVEETWKSSVKEYGLALEILRSRVDLTDEQILKFQRHIDIWFQDWIEISGGRTGMTNYIHMLSSGHIAEYLFKWKNLYVHSQQGWEALNSMIKTFFMRRTGRGSAGGKGEKSRLKPLGRWFQRRMLWMTGYTMEDFVKSGLHLEPAVVQQDSLNDCHETSCIEEEEEQDDSDIHNTFLL